LYPIFWCVAHQGAFSFVKFDKALKLIAMSKVMDKKKEAKKEPTKTLKEKRAEKKAKKAEKYK